MIVAMLAKLALQYWRPDFSPEQAKHLYSDYLDDLRGFSIKALADAIKKYRTDGANKFFPTSGQIIEKMLSPRDPSVPDRENTRRNELAYEKSSGARELAEVAGTLLIANR
jgi:hypothetical protein